MEEKLELRLIHPNENGFLDHIDWNMEEIRERVQLLMSAYTNVVYTEDTMKSAKDDRATLNRFKKRIEDRRKEVKKKCMEPYERFEAEVREIVALINEPIAMIDSQIKDYENRIKEEKRQALQKYHDEIATGLDGILSFDKVFDQRYLNASVSLNKAKSDMQEKVDRVRNDLKNLEVFCDDKYLAIAKDTYIKTMNVSKALAEANRIQEFERKAEEERLRRQEEKKQEATISKMESVAKPEQNVIKEPEIVSEPEESEPQSVIGKTIASIERQAYEQATSGNIDVPDTTSKVQEDDTKRYKASFTVYGTKAQIMALRDYMNEHNIKFGKAEK